MYTLYTHIHCIHLKMYIVLALYITQTSYMNYKNVERDINHKDQILLCINNVLFPILWTTTLSVLI